MRATEAPAIELITEPLPAPPWSVALLSGSFDPVTIGHVALAEAALATSELAVFVYSVRTLPKEGRSVAEEPLLDEIDRLRALVGVCDRNPRFGVAVSSRGLLVEQVEAAAAAFEGAELSVILGSDKLLQLFDPHWYKDPDAAIPALLERATVRYGIRSGDEDAVGALLERHEIRPLRDRLTALDAPAEIAAVSSSRVRELIRSGTDVSNLVPSSAFLRRRGVREP
jgi:nicotinic acid mononucleotide adenylyltransferase